MGFSAAGTPTENQPNPRLIPKRAGMPSEAVDILFVDDEESIRVLLPAVLEQHGFRVRTAASVPEALVEINATRFDVLICDLNLEKPGDGFLVLSAMRHLHPDCVNLILTGYPAFETALEAIHHQVDDYLVKPADIEALISTIQKKLDARRTAKVPTPRRLAAVLQEHSTQLIERTVDAVEHHRGLSAVRLARDERVQHLSGLLDAVQEQLERERDAPSEEQLRMAREYGKARKSQGYTAGMLVLESQLIEGAITDLVRIDLMNMAIAGLFYDIVRVHKCLGVLVLAALEAYDGAEPTPRKKSRRETVGSE
jgi:ActR/RegA family two-component response regulator